MTQIYQLQESRYKNRQPFIKLILFSIHQEPKKMEAYAHQLLYITEFRFLNRFLPHNFRNYYTCMNSHTH